MSELNSGSIYSVQNIYNENEVAEILSHFESPFIIQTIQDNLEKRYSFNSMVPATNIVAAFEQNFKEILSRYPAESENIIATRNNTYAEIANTLCNYYKLQYTADATNIYTIAYYLFDFLSSRYIENIVNFFATYIFNNCDTLYDSLKLNIYKKNKDADTAYTKHQYELKPKLAIITANLDYVIYNICGFDIDIPIITSHIYDAAVSDIINSCLRDTGNFYKNFYAPNFLSNICKATMLTNVRLRLHEIYNQSIVNI